MARSRRRGGGFDVFALLADDPRAVEPLKELRAIIDRAERERADWLDRYAYLLFPPPDDLDDAP